VTIDLRQLRRVAKTAQAGELYRQGCSAKRPYKTERKAKDAVIAKREEGVKVRLTVYRCGHCRMWHLTSHPKASK
jgi:hypothetical protein